METIIIVVCIVVILSPFYFLARHIIAEKQGKKDMQREVAAALERARQELCERAELRRVVEMVAQKERALEMMADCLPSSVEYRYWQGVQTMADAELARLGVVEVEDA